MFLHYGLRKLNVTKVLPGFIWLHNHSPFTIHHSPLTIHDKVYTTFTNQS